MEETIEKPVINFLEINGSSCINLEGKNMHALASQILIGLGFFFLMEGKLRLWIVTHSFLTKF